ncbi:MAG: methionyl-tRNA formyltransferase [Acidimicrobiales bacterium]|nr:methionyl-tRNA formyltransferase [Acidimicrobiales bacterium]
MATELPLPPAGAQRLAFFGSPAMAVPTLRALVDAGFEVAMVVTGHDKRRGRGSKTSPTPVKAAALELGLPITTEIADAVAADVDLGVVVAFGKIIPRAVIEEVPMVNLHFSSLPRWRGAAPIERAILSGDSDTAISIITIAVGLDEGDIWAEEPVAIGELDTADDLRVRMAAGGADLMVRTIREGFPASVPQQGEPVYAAKIHPSDLEIDWSAEVEEVLRQVRVGGAWTTLRGERFKIWEALPADGQLGPGEIDATTVGTGAGALSLGVVQPAGKPRLAAADWANGAQLDGSDRFGE